MTITLLVGSIWLFLMLRAIVAEYQYYQSVKVLESGIWEQLGSPRWLKIPMVFISPKNAVLLSGISNQAVRARAKKHRQAGIVFIAYVTVILLGSIVYFKLA